MIRGSRLTAALVAALLLALGAGAVSASAQFTNYQAAQDDQYGQPPGSQPTPPPNPTDKPNGRPDDPGNGNGREQGRGNDDDDAGVGGAGDGRNGGGVGGNQDTLPLRAAQGGSLPFTGLDLSLIVLLGLVLTAGGVAGRAAPRASVRRAARA